MEKMITYESLRSFAYVNDQICKQPVRGIVVSFFGLGTQDMFDADTAEGKFFAEKGILYVVPYNNPWAWMNRQAAAYTDEILDVLIDRYGLGDELPVVSTGGSMGGQSALVYMSYAKRTPISCVANCPVCDAVFHFTERPDLPRTMYSALYYENGTLDEVLRSISPLHLIGKLPQVKYHIFHCSEDRAVNKERHSDVFVEKMRQSGYDLTYDIVPGRGHCDLTEDMKVKYLQYAVEDVEGAAACKQGLTDGMF